MGARPAVMAEASDFRAGATSRDSILLGRDSNHAYCLAAADRVCALGFGLPEAHLVAQALRLIA